MNENKNRPLVPEKVKTDDTWTVVISTDQEQKNEHPPFGKLDPEKLPTSKAKKKSELTLWTCVPVPPAPPQPPPLLCFLPLSLIRAKSSGRSSATTFPTVAPPRSMSQLFSPPTDSGAKPHKSSKLIVNHVSQDHRSLQRSVVQRQQNCALLRMFSILFLRREGELLPIQRIIAANKKTFFGLFCYFNRKLKKQTEHFSGLKKAFEDWWTVHRTARTALGIEMCTTPTVTMHRGAVQQQR